MNENKLIEEFWKDCDDMNFSREAVVLFFYLIYMFHTRRNSEIKLHPNKLSSVIKGFTPQHVATASEELQKRGYIDYKPATETCSSGTYRFVKSGCEKLKRNRPVASSKPSNSK